MPAIRSGGKREAAAGFGEGGFDSCRQLHNQDRLEVHETPDTGEGLRLVCAMKISDYIDRWFFGRPMGPALGKPIILPFDEAAARRDPANATFYRKLEFGKILVEGRATIVDLSTEDFEWLWDKTDPCYRNSDWLSNNQGYDTVIFNGVICRHRRAPVVPKKTKATTKLTMFLDLSDQRLFT